MTVCNSILLINVKKYTINSQLLTLELSVELLGGVVDDDEEEERSDEMFGTEMFASVLPLRFRTSREQAVEGVNN